MKSIISITTRKTTGVRTSNIFIVRSTARDKLRQTRRHSKRNIGTSQKEVPFLSLISKHGMQRVEKTPKATWIRELAAKGLIPKIEPLEIIEGEWREREMEWMFHFEKDGNQLLNVERSGKGKSYGRGNYNGK